MITPAEWAAQQQVYAAWMQAGSLGAAAVLAAALFGLQAWQARKRERQCFELVRGLAAHARTLFHDGAQALAGPDPLPARDSIAAIGREGRELRAALLALGLERLPDVDLSAAVLALRRCVGQLDDLPAEAAALCRQLHAQADAAAARIDALMHLRRRCEEGMPSTAVDQYATFALTEEFCVEPDGVDFVVLVNQQSVLCTIAHAELEALAGAAADGLAPVPAPVPDYAALFRQWRTDIGRAAERLIRAGARAPVHVLRAPLFIGQA